MTIISARKTIINLHKRPSVKSEVVTQMLFGESFSISKKSKKWLKIKIKEDNYIGFIKNRNFSNYLKPTHKVCKLKANVYKTIQKARLRNLKVILDYDGPIKAPIIKDQKVGKVKIFYKDDLIETLDLLASENIEEVNKFTKLIRSINFLIWGDV